MHGLDRQGHVHRRRRHDLRRRQGRPDEQDAARADDRLQRDGAERLQQHREPAARRVPRARGDEPARAADPGQPLAGPAGGPGSRRATRACARGAPSRSGSTAAGATSARSCSPRATRCGCPNRTEWAWNAGYSRIAEQAAAARQGLWNPAYCGLGPSDALAAARDRQRGRRRAGRGQPQRRVDPRPQPGPRQRGPPRRLVAARLRAAAATSFPDWATLPPGESLTVYVGGGTDTWTEFFWDRAHADLREPDRRRAGDGRRRLPVRPAGRPARHR